VPLKEEIAALLELPDDELRGPRAAALEDAVQRALTAVHVGELWINQLTRALAERSHDAEHRKALETELASSRRSVTEVRRSAAQLHQRANELGVGDPLPR
jgi:uncharacterized damage-inducible protein DinB